MFNLFRKQAVKPELDLEPEFVPNESSPARKTVSEMVDTIELGYDTIYLKDLIKKLQNNKYNKYLNCRLYVRRYSFDGVISLTVYGERPECDKEYARRCKQDWGAQEDKIRRLYSELEDAKKKIKDSNKE